MIREEEFSGPFIDTEEDEVPEEEVPGEKDEDDDLLKDDDISTDEGI